MGALDTLITFAVVTSILFIVGSKIYNHEKDQIDPLIKKIKGFIHKDDGDGEPIGPDDDFELSFKGQME